MVCSEYQETLSSYLDDEVKPLERLRIDAHLRGCGPCRRYLRQIRHARELLGRLDRVQAPEFAVRRARGIALGARSRRWEHLRGGLTVRPQQLSLKPVLLAGLAFLLVLVVAKNLPGLGGPSPSETQDPGPTAAPAPQAPGRLPGTLDPAELTDAQKAEIARRVLASRTSEEGGAALEEPPAAGAPADPVPADAVRPDAGDPSLSSSPMTARNAARTADPDPIPGVRAHPSGTVGAAPERSEPPAAADPDAMSRRAAAAEQPPASRSTPEAGPAIALLEAQPPVTAPAQESAQPAASPPPPAPSGRHAAPETGDHPAPLELEASYTEVLVLSALPDGGVAAEFQSPAAEKTGPLLALRREATAEFGLLQGEARAEARDRWLDELPPAEADPQTGVAAPQPVLLPAPRLEPADPGALDPQFVAPIALRVRVEVDGSVAEAKVVSGSGLAWLDEAVARAVGEWTFRPAEIDGIPSPSVIEVVVELEQE